MALFAPGGGGGGNNAGGEREAGDAPVGVALWALQRFVVQNRGKISGTISAGSVCNEVVKPLTKFFQCSYVELLRAGGDSGPKGSGPPVARANVFVSHAWKRPFLDMVAAAESRLGADSAPVFIWVDIFCLNQHSRACGLTGCDCGSKRVPSSLDNLADFPFRQAIASTGRVVAILDPWDNPLLLTRLWCLFELLCAVESEALVEFAVTPPQAAELARAIAEDLDAVVASLCACVRVRAATASVPADRAALARAIEEGGGQSLALAAATPCSSAASVTSAGDGFDALEGAIRRLLRRWLADTGLRAIAALAVPERGTSLAIDQVAGLLSEEGRLSEAGPLYVEAVWACRRALGDRHEDTITSVNNYGAWLYRQGRLHEAEPLFREALAARREALGPAHDDTVASANNLAWLLRGAGRAEEAERLFREAHGARRESLGARHPSTLDAASNLARCVADQPGREEEAERLFQAAFAGLAEALGPSHPRALASLANLAALAEERGATLPADLEGLHAAAADALDRVPQPLLLRRLRDGRSSKASTSRRSEASASDIATPSDSENSPRSPRRRASESLVPSSSASALGDLASSDGGASSSAGPRARLFDRPQSAGGPLRVGLLSPIRGDGTDSCANDDGEDAEPSASASGADAGADLPDATAPLRVSDVAAAAEAQALRAECSGQSEGPEDSDQSAPKAPLSASGLSTPVQGTSEGSGAPSRAETVASGSSDSTSEGGTPPAAPEHGRPARSTPFGTASKVAGAAAPAGGPSGSKREPEMANASHGGGCQSDWAAKTPAPRPADASPLPLSPSTLTPSADREAATGEISACAQSSSAACTPAASSTASGAAVASAGLDGLTAGLTPAALPPAAAEVPSASTPPAEPLGGSGPPAAASPALSAPFSSPLGPDRILSSADARREALRGWLEQHLDSLARLLDGQGIGAFVAGESSPERALRGAEAASAAEVSLRGSPATPSDAACAAIGGGDDGRVGARGGSAESLGTRGWLGTFSFAPQLQMSAGQSGASEEAPRGAPSSGGGGSGSSSDGGGVEDGTPGAVVAIIRQELGRCRVEVAQCREEMARLRERIVGGGEASTPVASLLGVTDRPRAGVAAALGGDGDGESHSSGSGSPGADPGTRGWDWRRLGSSPKQARASPEAAAAKEDCSGDSCCGRRTKKKGKNRGCCGGADQWWDGAAVSLDSLFVHPPWFGKTHNSGGGGDDDSPPLKKKRNAVVVE